MWKFHIYHTVNVFEPVPWELWIVCSYCGKIWTLVRDGRWAEMDDGQRPPFHWEPPLYTGTGGNLSVPWRSVTTLDTFMLGCFSKERIQGHPFLMSEPQKFIFKRIFRVLYFHPEYQLEGLGEDGKPELDRGSFVKNYKILVKAGETVLYGSEFSGLVVSFLVWSYSRGRFRYLGALRVSFIWIIWMSCLITAKVTTVSSSSSSLSSLSSLLSS